MKVVYKTLNGTFRIPDPNSNSSRPYRMIIQTAVKDLPEGLPAHGNPRKPNIDRKLYEKVADSFRKSDNDLFLYQNRGITVIAESIVVSGDQTEVEVEISDNPADKGGVVDGRHTETLLLGNGDTPGIRDERPDQAIMVTLLYGIEKPKRTGVTVALNSTIPISQLSNLNAQGFFETLKAALVGTPMEDRVQFEQNGEGERDASVAHLIEVMYVLRLDLFNSNLDSVTERGKHPSYVITATKQKIHEAFPSEQQEYEKMYPLIKDICFLYDFIEGKSAVLYARQKKSKEAFKDAYVTTWRGSEAKSVLHRNAVLPMLSAFRSMLQIGDMGIYEWKIPFKQVLHLFARQAGTWVARLTKSVSGLGDADSRSNQLLISALQEYAKSRDEWTRMYDDLDLRYRKDAHLLSGPFQADSLEPLKD